MADYKDLLAKAFSSDETGEGSSSPLPGENVDPDNLGNNKYMMPAIQAFLANPSRWPAGTKTSEISKDLGIEVYKLKDTTEQEKVNRGFALLYIHAFFSRHKIWDIPVAQGIWQTQRYDIEIKPDPYTGPEAPFQPLQHPESDIAHAIKDFFDSGAVSYHDPWSCWLLLSLIIVRSYASAASHDLQASRYPGG